MPVLPLGISWFLAVGLAFLDGRRGWVGWLSVGALASTLAALVWLSGIVLEEGPVEMVAGGWPPGVGITIRADSLGVLFALLSTAVLLMATSYEVIGGVRTRTFPALVLLMATGLNGLFLTGDVFNFYVFFEVSMTAAFVLASYGEEGRHMRATLIFVVVNLLGSVLFLSAVASLYHVTGSLDMLEIASRVDAENPTPIMLVATLLLVAFGTKLGLFPFHYWLPAVYRDTIPAVTAILAGALANIGSFGLLRFGAEILPEALHTGATALLVLGSLSIVYGEIQAVSRFPADEVLAYSSIGQVGYVLIALAIGGLAGYTAAIFYTVANSLNKTTLFLGTERQGKLISISFPIGAFSVAGVPPSVGFFGKVTVFQAAISVQNWTIVALVFLGGALSLIYMFQIYQRDFWAEQSRRGDSPLVTQLPVLVPAVVLIALGVWPEPLLAFSQRVGAVLSGGLP